MSFLQANGRHYNGWLEPTDDVSTWLKKIRNVQDDGNGEANLQSYINGGYVSIKPPPHYKPP